MLMLINLLHSEVRDLVECRVPNATGQPTRRDERWLRRAKANVSRNHAPSLANGRGRQAIFRRVNLVIAIGRTGLSTSRGTQNRISCHSTGRGNENFTSGANMRVDFLIVSTKRTRLKAASTHSYGEISDETKYGKYETE